MPDVAIVRDDNVLEAVALQNRCECAPRSFLTVKLLTGPPGPAGTEQNSNMRAYVYPTPQPSTPQLYSMIWIDALGTPWLCAAGTTTWKIINTVA